MRIGHRQAPGWLGGQAFELLGTRLYHLASLCLLMYIAFQLWRGSLPVGPAPMLLSRHGGSLGGAPAAPCATPPQRARARAQDCAALGWTPPGPRPDGCPPCPTCSCTEGEPCECPLECPSWQQAGQQAGQAAQRCPQPEQAPAGCDLHGKYDLAHLTQRQPQQVVGPVQDDEALLLYALVRGMRMQAIVEIGGLGGYSARNFLRAMDVTNGTMYTVDLNPVPRQDPVRHVTVQKNVFNLTAEDLDSRKFDLIFFDAHVVEPQMHLYSVMEQSGMVDEHTMIALHDTNLHPENFVGWAQQLEGGGWVHQRAERVMVNRLRQLGWDALSLHPPFRVHGPQLPFRHGVTLMQRFRPMAVSNEPWTGPGAEQEQPQEQQQPGQQAGQQGGPGSQASGPEVQHT